MGAHQDFEAALQTLKTELIQDLNHTDVLKRDKLEAIQTEYNQKIVKLQADFLRMLSSTNHSVRLEMTLPQGTEPTDFGKIVLTGFGTGGAVLSTLTFITFGVPQIATTTVWFFWTTTTTTTTTVTLAAWLAGILGISTTLATTILTGGIGTVAMVTMYFSFFPVWRRRIRKKLIEQFDSTIIPVLRDWADEVINKFNSVT